jgi:hypothetical protein
VGRIYSCMSYAVPGDGEFRQPYRHTVLVLPAQTCQVSICVFLLLSDWSFRHNVTEPVCMDIFYVHIFKRKGTFQLYIKSHPMIY